MGGVLTVQGNFTQSVSGATSPVLDFPVAGAAGTNLAPNFTVTGATTLAGNLTAEYAGGFASASGTSYTAAHFASAASGAFASTAGTAPDFTPAVGPTSIILNGTTTGASDLQLLNVTAPSIFTPGQSGTVSWHVTDATADANGNWTDSVYLSADGTVNGGDILLGRVAHTGGLGVGSTYTGTLNAVFPARRAPIRLWSSSTAVRSFPTPTARTMSCFCRHRKQSSCTDPWRERHRHSQSRRGLDLHAQPDHIDRRGRVNLSLANPLLTDLEISRGVVPTTGDAQYSAPLSSSSTKLGTTITHPIPGIYYIRLHGQTEAGPAGQSFTLSAAAATYGVFGVSPSTVGAGLANLTVSGSGFATGSSAQLLDSGNHVVADASKATVQSANTLLLDFDLTNVPAGVFNLKVTSGVNPPRCRMPLPCKRRRQ